MSVKIEMFMIVGRKYLDEYYSSSFKQYENCCGVCWCWIKKKSILDEFEKKGFNSFNSNVKDWKLMDNLNKFEIFPLDLKFFLLKLLIQRNLQF